LLSLIGIRKPAFIARQRVELSGIYRVVHDRNHLRPHLVTAAQGSSFPPCKNKSCHPRFVLLRTAPLLHDHPELVG